MKLDLSIFGIDQELLDRTNPKYSTAKRILVNLAQIGNPEAQAIADALGITSEDAMGNESELLSPKLAACNEVLIETRYETMGKIAEESGCDVVVSLPCGFAPNAVKYAREGKLFVGLDRPAIINEAEPAIMSLIDEDKRDFVRLRSIDAKNNAALEDALEGLDGSLCIIAEGLLNHFTAAESLAFCNGIHEILEQHGGCLITTDVEGKLRYVLTMKALLDDQILETLLDSLKKEDGLGDPADDSSLIIKPGPAATSMNRKAKEFLAQLGFEAERMTVAEYMPELKSLEQFTPAQIEAYRQAMAKTSFWKLTAKGEKEELDTSSLKMDTFDVSATRDGFTLRLSLKGRLDTVSAPKLQALFEQVQDEIKRVEIDCRNLDYMSSAGIRLLLIMRRTCKQGVALSNMNDTVRLTVLQTGLEMFLEVND